MKHLGYVSGHTFSDRTIPDAYILPSQIRKELLRRIKVMGVDAYQTNQLGRSTSGTLHSAAPVKVPPRHPDASLPTD